MPIREIIICLLFILFPLAGAYADSTIEIRPQRGVFLLENFQQSLGMTYQYSGHDEDTAGSNYMTNKLVEIYRFMLSGAIVDRHLLNFQLNSDIWFQQIESSSDSQGSSSSGSSKYQYNLAASAFDRKWHPVNIHSSRVLSTVANAFTPAYNSDSTSNGIEVHLQKGPVPTRIRYDRYTLDLSGAGYDSSATSHAVSMSANHNFRDFSASSLSGSWSSSESTAQGVSQTSGNVSLGFGNNLFWGREKNYSLTSQLNWQKTEIGDVPQENLTLNETFLWHVGKALDADLAYRYLQNKTTTLEGRNQVYSTNAVSASVTHHLFQSLDTRLRGQVSHSDVLGGTEDAYSGSGSLTYRKKLPSYSLLTVVLYGEHGVTDRQSGVTATTIRDEAHIVTQPNEIITLGIAGPLQPGSVTVRGFLAPPPAPQIPHTYTESINGGPGDFTVDYDLGRIIWGNVVPALADIQVTYAALSDAALKYATDTESISGNLSWLSGKYSLLASIFNQNQYLVSGQTQNNLRDTTIMRVRFQGRAAGTVYGLEYEDYSSGPSQYQFVEAWCLYTRTNPTWTLTLQARDRYTSYDSVGASDGYGQNTLSISANYSRSLIQGLYLSLAGSFVDSRRDNKDSSSAIYAKANLRARFNKLDANLTGQSSFRLYGDSSTRDDYIRIDITRYF